MVLFEVILVLIFCAKDSEEKNINEMKIVITIKFIMVDFIEMMFFNIQQNLQIVFNCYIHFSCRELENLFDNGIN